MPRNRSEKSDPVRKYLLFRWLLLHQSTSHQPAEVAAWDALTEVHRKKVCSLSHAELNKLGVEAYIATQSK